jgi:hypothetical protein
MPQRHPDTSCRCRLVPALCQLCWSGPEHGLRALHVQAHASGSCHMPASCATSWGAAQLLAGAVWQRQSPAAAAAPAGYLSSKRYIIPGCGHRQVTSAACTADTAAGRVSRTRSACADVMLCLAAAGESASYWCCLWLQYMHMVLLGVDLLRMHNNSDIFKADQQEKGFHSLLTGVHTTPLSSTAAADSKSSCRSRCSSNSGAPVGHAATARSSWCWSCSGRCTCSGRSSRE